MKADWERGGVRLIQGDCRDVLRSLPDQSVHCCVTSPPYFGLRDYGCGGQIGLEPTPEAFVAQLVNVFREVRRVLRDDGTLWLNLGDSYCTTPRGNREGDLSTSSLTNPKRQDQLWGKHKYRMQDREPRVTPRVSDVKPKDLLGIPWMVAFALRADGWYLRQDIIWHKPNPMPESVRDRCTKAHEYLFLLSKSPRYYFDQDAIRTPLSAETKDLSFDTMDYKLRDKYRGWKTPDGWDTSSGDGGHGSFHKDGREKGQKGYTQKSGNNKRKPATERGCPEDGVAGSVPWERVTANKRSVWTVANKAFTEAHFATFPPALIRPCILAGCPESGTVLDPFAGSGTTLAEAYRLNRCAVGIELSAAYCEIAKRRIGEQTEATPLLDDIDERQQQAEMFGAAG